MQAYPKCNITFIQKYPFFRGYVTCIQYSVLFSVLHFLHLGGDRILHDFSTDEEKSPSVNYYPKEWWCYSIDRSCGLNKGDLIIGHGFADNGKTLVAQTSDSKVFFI